MPLLETDGSEHLEYNISQEGNATFSSNKYDNITLSDPGQSNITKAIVTLFHEYPPALLSFGAACCIVFSIIGIPGNLISIGALARSPRLRNATTTFIINLCVADAIFCAFSIPLSASTFLRRKWVHGDALCVLFPLIRYSNVAVSLLSVVAITVNRYVLIVHPQKYKSIYKKHWIAIMVAAIWLFSFICLLPPLLNVWGKFGFDPTVGTCTILKVNGRSPKVFLYVFAFVLPSVAFVICYSRIFCVVRKAHKNIKERPDNTRTEGGPKSPRILLQQLREKFHPSSEFSGKRKKELTKDIRLLRMILVIFFTFVICYLPVTIIKITRKEDDLPVINILGYVSIYFSSCINPIIYVLMSQEYRQAYKKCFNCSKDLTSSSSS
ncbi:G-protein coupled receptor moody-like [Limulus polyphemus]|uniref:G-protein coupled receptor moody-like n=1 Tax=Limulus polyphemus TaxID=6850 RepID=A0ABM1T9V1_LIMPO|nr:G-protein coupled receptor moody-like [Limulus polyphemus]